MQAATAEVQVDVLPDAPQRSTTRAKLKKQATNLGAGVKKNPKKAAGCGCTIMAVVIIVIILGAVGVIGAAIARYVLFTGDIRTASVGGAAMGQAQRGSLIPVKEAAATVATRRRHLQVATTGLAQCPRDSQAIIDDEATPTSVFDGTTIFQTVDMINCLMSKTKPGASQTINLGAYTATVNEKSCLPTSQSGDGGGGGGGFAQGAGAGSGSSGSGATAAVSLKTLAVNSTRPSAENPTQPFSTKLVMAFTPPPVSSSSGSTTATTTTASTAPADHLICFEFVGYKFDNTTNKFTDYELTFASCVEPTTSGTGSGNPFQVRGRINVKDASDLELSTMHAMLPNAASTTVMPANWTDLEFRMVTTDQYGDMPAQGRSVYEKVAAVGCAKAAQGDSTQDICFDGATVRTVVTKLGGAPTSSDGSTATSTVEPPSEMCKSRSLAFTLTETKAYRAYKLCDTPKCSGTHDCQESGPVNNVNIYLCKPNLPESSTPGCQPNDRKLEGYMYVYSANEGAQLHTYQPYIYSDYDPSKPEGSPPPPPPSPSPSPPPSEAAAFVPEFPDGTKVWKENYGSDDKEYTIRRTPGRLVRVKQDALRLCDMPGTYTVGEQKSVQVSFEVDAVGKCAGALRKRDGVNVGLPFTLGREHLDRNLSPLKPQFAVLTNGRGGGASYRLPVTTEYWQLVKVDTPWLGAKGYSASNAFFAASPVPLGTPLTFKSKDWVQAGGTWTEQTTDHATTVAAATYQVQIEQDYAAMFSKELADIAAEKDCVANPNDPYSLPHKCQRLQCTTVTGKGCGTRPDGAACDYCGTYYPAYFRPYQPVRLPPASGQTDGSITAEMLVSIDSQYTYAAGTFTTEKVVHTTLIQCVETTGDATSEASDWLPKDVGTSPHCGLTTQSGGWLYGPEEDHGDCETCRLQSRLLGKLTALQSSQAVLVKSPAGSALLPQYTYDLRMGTSIAGVNSTGGSINLLDVRFQHSRYESFPGKVLAQPTGTSLVNFTIRESVSPGTVVSGLKCLHNCIDPTLIGSTASPPNSNAVVHNYGECASWEASQPGGCNKPDPYSAQKVSLNHTFDEYAWTSEGLNFCGLSAEGGSGEILPSQYTVADCTQPVAVPTGTKCTVSGCDGSTGGYCHCNNWEVKSTLFQDANANNFLCRTSGSSTGTSTSGSGGPAPPSSSSQQACLTKAGSNSNQVPNVDDLSEYYEYVTGVPGRWRSHDSIWLESVEPPPKAPEKLQLEPPLQLTLQVPCDGTAPASISGTNYACKKFVATFSEGIDTYNSPGFPLWCLNRKTGLHKPPITDNWGNQMCMDWSKISQTTNFDWDNEFYELYPDVNPELNWDTFDGKTLRWGLKPAEKTLVYSKIGNGNCTGTTSITNPITLVDAGQAIDGLRDPVAKLRTNTAELKRWYEANKANQNAVKVHTGQFVGAAANATSGGLSVAAASGS